VSGVSRKIAVLAGCGVVVAAMALAAPAGASASVRLVCQGNASSGCPNGHYSSIQGAVDAAAPGDWVLVGPGVYHEKGTAEAGVSITKPGIHLRGWDRNRVVVDGTNAGAAQPCSSDPARQDFNAGAGRNGIEVTKVDGTYVENLTVCNYLSSPGGEQGNEIWWNGGDGSGQIGMGTYWGNYLTATSTFYGGPDTPMGEYGIFVSNADGPGSVTQAYASNMADSAFYVGACPDCNTTLDQVHAENSALGYSGTNSGGHLVIQNSEWDLNEAGIVPNSLNNDDAPPPQSGLCPGSTTQSCTFIQHNHVHDNNNPNVPGSGIAGAAPVGAGIEVSGGSFDTVRDNTVDHQGGWGIVVHDFPDSETPPASGVSSCQGGTQVGPVCQFNARGNVVSGNALSANGGFGNPTNGDLGNEPAQSNPRNCFFGNTDSAGLSSDPPNIQTVDGPPCDQPGVGDDGVLAAELVCASGLVSRCTIPGANYPTQTQVRMLPLQPQPSMPNPCAGAPDNSWCSGGQPTRQASKLTAHPA
jgi:hypothetical protein